MDTVLVLQLPFELHWLWARVLVICSTCPCFRLLICLLQKMFGSRPSLFNNTNTSFGKIFYHELLYVSVEWAVMTLFVCCSGPPILILNSLKIFNNLVTPSFWIFSYKASWQNSFFTMQNYASTVIMTVCSVALCPSVCHEPEYYQNSYT